MEEKIKSIAAYRMQQAEELISSIGSKRGVNRILSDFNRFICKTMSDRRATAVLDTGTTSRSESNSDSEEDDNSNFYLSSKSIDRLSMFYRPVLSDRYTLVSTSKYSKDKSYGRPTTSYKEKKELKGFYDGSRYLGEWNSLGFAGRGIYKYPHGVVYDGYFNENGEFQGPGTLIYPNGKKVDGLWNKGKLITNIDFKLSDQRKSTRSQIEDKDRRFSHELFTGLRGPGTELITKEQPMKPLPDHCFDVVSGTYRAHKHYTVASKTTQRSSITSNVFSKLDDYVMDEEVENFVKSLESSSDDYFLVEDGKKVIEIPNPTAEEWIEKYTRRFDDKPIGYNPDLYETFTSGSNKQVEDLERNAEVLRTEYAEKYPIMRETLLPTIFTIHVNKKSKRRRTFLLDEPKKLNFEKMQETRKDHITINHS